MEMRKPLCVCVCHLANSSIEVSETTQQNHTVANQNVSFYEYFFKLKQEILERERERERDKRERERKTSGDENGLT